MTKDEMIAFIELPQEDREKIYKEMTDTMQKNEKALSNERSNVGWCRSIIELDPK